MERLTGWDGEHAFVVKCFEKEGCNHMDSPECIKCPDYMAVFDKLARYEDICPDLDRIKAPFVGNPPLRPCFIGKEQRAAMFHCWSHQAWVVGASPMVMGPPKGQMATTLAIVEYADGTVAEVVPAQVHFTDTDATGALAAPP